MREAILILLCVICCRVESWTAIQDVRNVLDIAQTVQNMANQQQMIKAKQQMANRSMIPNQQRTRKGYPDEGTCQTKRCCLFSLHALLKPFLPCSCSRGDAGNEYKCRYALAKSMMKTNGKNIAIFL